MPRILVHPLEHGDQRCRRSRSCSATGPSRRHRVAVVGHAPRLQQRLHRTPSARGVPRPPRAAPSALSSVSAYRFWLTFIMHRGDVPQAAATASTRAHADVPRAGPRRVSAATSSKSTASPLTGMPRGDQRILQRLREEERRIHHRDCARATGAAAERHRAGDFEHRRSRWRRKSIVSRRARGPGRGAVDQRQARSRATRLTIGG